jgi:hypothetical protein
MSNKINIKFAAQGHPGVIAAVKSLNKQVEQLAANNRMLVGASGPLTVAQKKTADGFLAQQKAARNVGGTFSVLRSQMLLASFASTLFAASLLKLANMAGDAEEQMAKASVVFGASTDSVLDFAQQTSDATGRSRFSLIQMTASVQDILVPMGMLRHEAANLSKEIVKTAIDVASFNNVSESDAMRDFNSALVGNHETVRKYGIVISEARMQQVAMDQGLIEAGETLTDQEKILARLAILQMDSSDAQGDAIRTADSYANVMKALSAEFEETAIILGQKLMPIVKAFAELTISLLQVLSNKKVWIALSISLTVAATSFIKAKIASDGFTAAMVTARSVARKFALSLGVFGVALLAVEAIGYIWPGIFPDENDTDDATKGLKDVNKELSNFKDNLLGLTILQLETQLAEFKNIIENQDIAALIGTSIGEAGIIDVEFNFDSEKQPEFIPYLTPDQNKLMVEQIAILEQRLGNLTGANLDFSKSQGKVRKEMDKLEVSMREYNTDGDIAKQRLANELMDKYGLTVGKVKKEQEALEKELETFIELEGKSIGLNQIARLEKRIAKVQGVSAAQMFLNEQAAKGVVISTEHADRIRELNTQFEEEKERMQSVAEGQQILNKIVEEAGNKELIEIENKILKLEALAEETGLTNELAEAIANLKAQKEELEDLDGKTHKLSIFRNKAEKDSTLLLMNSMSAMAGQHKQGQKAAARISQLAAVINTYEGVTEALSTKDYIGAATILAQGLASVAQIENAMGKMGAGGGGGSKPTGPGGALQFEDGGYVGGRRHSEGGTLIEAERGEFVMSRRAVESIGLETLNQMNRGGGTAGGNVVINVSGNVMTQDFVEGELAEQIKEAVRRGSDFGIG